MNTEIIEYIIVNSPYLISLCTIYLLRNNTPYVWAFVIGSWINMYMNKLLKSWIRLPRPDLQRTETNETAYPFYIGAEKYGMPSGYAQILFFAITFLFLVKRYITITYLFLFLACIVLYQRWIYKHNTFEQLAAGIITGSVFAYCIVLGTNQYVSDKSICI